jgi:hypothetical protein
MHQEAAKAEAEAAAEATVEQLSVSIWQNKH